MLLSRSLFLALVVSTPVEAYAQCKSWGEAEQIGELDHEYQPESSGLAISTDFEERLYHVNDGKKSEIFVTDFAGEITQSFAIAGFASQDTEDLAFGPCGISDGNCLFVADTGDNDSNKDFVSIAIVKEKEEFAAKEKPIAILKFTYTDGAHNTEGVALHPSGDIYLATKDETTKIFKIGAAEWQNAVRANEVITAEAVGDLELLPLSSGENEEGLITSFDISADGKSFVLLSETEVFAFALDLAATTRGDFDVDALVEAEKLEVVEVEALKKQEGIALLPNDAGFVYSTESKKKNAPLMQVLCID